MEQAQLFNKQDLERIINRFAYQFTEPYDDLSHLAIIGMQTRGVYIARRICKQIEKYSGNVLPFGVLDVTFFRDDFRTKMKMPDVQVTDIPFDLFEKDVILVDDVMYTGRTVRAAMDALLGFGRPKSLKFCCLVDRGHRELPISPDYTGKYVPTHFSEEIQVKIQEIDDEDAVYIVNKGEAR